MSGTGKLDPVCTETPSIRAALRKYVIDGMGSVCYLSSFPQPNLGDGHESPPEYGLTMEGGKRAEGSTIPGAQGWQLTLTSKGKKINF